MRDGMALTMVVALAALGCDAPPPASAPAPAAAAERQDDRPRPWRVLERGLELARFDVGEAKGAVLVLRIDPRRFELRLLSASTPPGSEPRTPRDWARRHELVAAINASLYQADGLTSVGLMRTREHVNNPRLGRDRTVLAFDARAPGVPAVRIIDRQCDSFAALSRRYGTLVQSIRMVSCRGRNVWSRRGDGWSVAAVGIDGRGRVLFIHSLPRWPTHDLVDALLELPLGLRQAMYTEGGPQAQLYVRAGGEEVERAGLPESPLLQGAASLVAWPLPNVIGVRRR